MTDDQPRLGTDGDDAQGNSVEESLRRAANTKDHLAKERVDQELQRRTEQRSAPAARVGRRPPAARFIDAGALSAAAVSGLLLFLLPDDTIAKTLLTALAVTVLLFLVIRYWSYYYIARVNELQEQLATTHEQLTLARTGHRSYLEAIERVSDRDRSLFTEELDITVWIGRDDDSDRIVERHITDPQPLVTHRTIRPIVPNVDDRLVRLDDIGFEARRESDGGVITAFPLREQVNGLKVWLVFDPGITMRTEWTVSYRPQGLWSPLRQLGWDQLAWDDRLRSVSGASTTLTILTMRFVFAVGQHPRVTERHGFGETAEPTVRPDGSWQVVWRDPRPAGRRYVWDLASPVEE